MMGFSREAYYTQGAQRLAEIFNPAVSAHIAIDVQKAYFQRPLSARWLIPTAKTYYERAEGIVAGITNLASTFQSFGVPNIWMRHDIKFYSDHFAGCISGMDYDKVSEYLYRFSKGADALCVEVDPKDVVDKKDWDGFECIRLKKKLKTQSIQTLFLTGGMREACVSATAKSAIQKGYHTFIVDDLLLEADPDLDNKPEKIEQYYTGHAEKGINFVTAQKVLEMMTP